MVTDGPQNPGNLSDTRKLIAEARAEIVDLLTKHQAELADHREHRSEYTDEHRIAIIRNRIPYCFQCHDWHEADETHSLYPF